MSDEMSAEPVAWMHSITRVVMSSYERARWLEQWPEQCEQFAIPLYAQSPAQARAMAIAEAARVCAQYAADEPVTYAKKALIACANEIQALSPAPSVSEEWIRERVEETFGKNNAFRAEDAVRATLAALGVTIEGATK